MKLASPIDLHLHSTASDGRLAPRELVALLAQRGVKVFALTDHDTVAGLPEAAAAAADHGLHLLRGTELSAEWLGRTIHVVGLGIQPEEPTLVAMLEPCTAMVVQVVPGTMRLRMVVAVVTLV